MVAAAALLMMCGGLNRKGKDGGRGEEAMGGLIVMKVRSKGLAVLYIRN